MRKIFIKMFDDAFRMNENNILGLLDENAKAKFIDLGCDDGKLTTELAKKIGTNDVYGTDINEAVLNEARSKNIIVKKADLNKHFPYENDFFDVVHTNQVIEHITDLDNFVSEIHRILKKGGYAIISTENGSSWHNIFAAIMGWQIFSSTNISNRKLGIGNPLTAWRDKPSNSSFWTHKTIFNYLGLKEIFEAYGFRNAGIAGAGYHPLPVYLGKFDPRHAHFITLKAYK